MQTIASKYDNVKSELLQVFAAEMDKVFQVVTDDTSSNRQLEENTWKMILSIGNATLSALIASKAKIISEQDRSKRGCSKSDVHMRMDKDYWGTVTTTLGTVSFPWYAYRRVNENGGTTTHNPSKNILFPAFDSCRSSALCLEWETRLGSDHPFRTAQAALTYFTHGAVHLEDNTIARHLVRIGMLVTREDMYCTVEQIKEVLTEQATRDRKTGYPLLYVSSDAHALRRYIDDTWATKWKMSNGIRLWCEDRKTGQIIHIGGEFTWGDCQDVREIFEDLIARGILPSNGDYGDDIQAQLVWLSDGMPWFKDHILPLFSGMVVILDCYHLIQAFSAFIMLCFRPKSKESRRWLEQVKALTVGSREPKAAKRTPRKGHRKSKQKNARHAHELPLDPNAEPVEQAKKLIKLLLEAPASSAKAKASQSRLFVFIFFDLERINYVAFRSRGYQIGSGAMESLHRIASQARLKLPGAKWLPYTSQSIFNIRMMRLVGNWETFWSKSNIEKRFANVQLPH